MFSETVELRGHLIDSLILPKVLDEVLNLGGSFRLQEVRIGQRREEPSYARVEIDAPDRATLDRILGRIKLHGAEARDEAEPTLAPAPADGVFPEGFYITGHQPAQVRLGGEWVEVEPCRAGCGLAVDAATRQARPVTFAQVRKGDPILVGHQGVRVRPRERTTQARHPLEFLASPLSPNQPKEAIIRAIAQEMRSQRQASGRIMVVAGETVVHTGAGHHLVRLIELGYVQHLFAGNALALYDVEQALYGTSQGTDLASGVPVASRQENSLRAANTVRAAGGLETAVAQGLLNRGIVHACLRHGVDLLLAASVRDEAVLPGAVTDALAAQEALAQMAQAVSLALIVATGVYSQAVARLLPASAWAICADISPAVVVRVTELGPFHTVGLVTDADPFLHLLLGYLE